MTEPSITRDALSTTGTFLSHFFHPFEILEFDQEAAEHYGVIRACLEAKGKPLRAMDMLVATQARANGLVVVTDNVKHFKWVPRPLCSELELSTASSPGGPRMTRLS